MNNLKKKIVLCLFAVVLFFLILSQTISAEEKVSDFELKIKQPKIVEIAPGETANFHAIVKNNGNSLENFTIDIDYEYMPGGLPNGWEIEFFPKDFNISKNSEKNININITSSISANFGDYEIYINITSKDNETAPASVDNCTVRIAFYKPDIVGDTHLDTFTGNFVHYEELNLRLKNRGNAKDVISAEIKSTDSPLSANWAGAKPEELLEPDNESNNYILRIRIAENTPYCMEKDYEIQLYLNSSKAPNKNEIITITVFVDKYANMSINLPQGNKAKIWLNKGSTAEFDLEITNTGNSKMSYIVWYFTGLPQFWTSIPNVLGLETTEVEQGLIVHFIIKVDVPLDVEEGVYDNIIFKIKPKEKSIYELEIKLCVEVMEYYSVDVTEEILDIIYPGVSKELNITVKNLGSKIDNFTVRFYSGYFEYASFTTETNFELERREKFYVLINISPPKWPIGEFWNFCIKTKSEHSGELGYDVIAYTYINLSIMPYYKPTLIGTTYDNAHTDGYVTEYKSFYLQLRNDGTARDTLNMSIIDTESPLGAHWNGVPPEVVQLDPYPPDISQSYELEIEIPKLTPFKTYNITLWVHSAMGKGKKADLQLEINKYFEVSMSIVGPETIPVYPNETSPKAEFTVNITNKGNTNMDLKLIYNGGLPNTKWTTDPGGEGRDFLDMGSKEYRLETIIIEPDDEAKEEIYSGIRFRLFPPEDELTYEEISLSVEIKEYREIKLKKVGGSYNVKPTSGNEKVGIPFDITNDGNVDEYVRLEILDSFYDTYPNATRWEVNFYSNNELNTKINSKDVQANSDETVYLGIIIPTSVDERSYVPADLSPYTIPIYGESSKESTVNSQEDLSLIIDSINEVHLEYSGETKKADAGETITFEVKVENYGNVVDTMTFDLVDENNWVHPLDEIYKEEFDVGEKRTIKVNLTVPTIAEDDDAEAGNYDIELRVKPTTGGTQQKITLPFKIRETYGCDIEIIDKYKSETMPQFGTEIKFKFKVTNLGNSEIENDIRIPAIDYIYNLSGSDFNKWDVRFQEAGRASKDELTLYIDPLDSEEITLVIDTKPYGGFIGTYGIMIRAYPLGHLEDEADPKNVWLNCTEPDYRLEWYSKSQNQNKIVEPDEDTKIEYTCYLENTGTEDDRVTIRAEPLDTDIKDWKVKFKTAEGEEDTVSYEITHGDKQTVTVVIYPDPDADYDPAPYKIEITAESEFNSRATDRLTILTTVKRPDLVILARDITVPEDVKEGDLAQITVKISNEGNAKARDVTVQFFSHIDMSDELDQKIITLPANSTATVTGDWDVEAGKYYITVYADKKNKIKEINEENNRATSSVTLNIEGKIFEGASTLHESKYMYIKLLDSSYTYPKKGTQFEISVKEKYGREIDILILDSNNFTKYKSTVNNQSGSFQYYTDGSFLRRTTVDYRFDLPKNGIFYLVIDNTIFPDNGASPQTQVSVDVNVKVNKDSGSPSYSTNDTTSSNSESEGNGDIISFFNIIIIIIFFSIGIILICFSIYRRKLSKFTRSGFYMPPPRYYSEQQENQSPIVIPEEPLEENEINTGPPNRDETPKKGF